MRRYQVDALVRYGPRASDYKWRKFQVRASGKGDAWARARELAQPGHIVGLRVNLVSLLGKRGLL